MENFYIYGDFENNQQIKKQLFELDGGHCVYCWRRFNSYLDPNLTIDHVIPKNRGGSNRLHNLVLSCEQCNHSKDSKGSRSYDDLVNYLLQKKRNRELFDKITFQTIPRRVLLRLPSEVRDRII